MIFKSSFIKGAEATYMFWQNHKKNKKIISLSFILDHGSAAIT